MFIKRSEVKQLSDDIRRIIDGQEIDIRDNREGAWSILKNDIHTLAERSGEQADALRRERDMMAENLTNISHQLKTPLTSMMIAADLLEYELLKNELSATADLLEETLDGVGGEDARTQDTPLQEEASASGSSRDTNTRDKQAEFLANIKIGLTRLEWLTSALLKMAKLDAEAVEFKKERVSAAELTKIAIEPLHILLDVKNQRVEAEDGYSRIAGGGRTQGTPQQETVGGVKNGGTYGGAETELTCDIRWSAEALTNIIKNASEYSPDGSVIHLAAGANPICAWVSVTDSGPGIERRDISGLFRRFEGSRSDKGYGVGLPLALAIMRRQNGDIEVSPGGNGMGATFTMKWYSN